jgi:hypothetical protein
MFESPNLYQHLGDPQKKEKSEKQDPIYGVGGKVKVEGDGYSHRMNVGHRCRMILNQVNSHRPEYNK